MLRLLCRKLQAHSPPLHDPPLIPFPVTRFLSASADAHSALVLTTLRSHGVPDDLSQSVVARFPRILTFDPDSSLSPKLAFLRSEGFSSPELAEILLRSPFFLSWSLDRFVSSVNFLKSVLPSKEDLLHVLKLTRKPFTPTLLANINLFKDHGLPEATILKLLLLRPRSLTCTAGHFVEALEYLKKLNVSPASTVFVLALGILSYMSRSTFQRKLELYKELGWTEEQLCTMIKRNPTILNLSDETFRKKVGYFRDTLGWCPGFLCSYPWIMTVNLEKRIIPRCAVLNLLMSNGLLKRKTSLGRKLLLKEESFVENFVKKHEETVPAVVEAYQGKIKFSGWDWLKDAKNQLEASGL